jgi:hypothetical protein
MTYEQKYTELEGGWHAIGAGEYTVCGIAIPFGNGYSLLPDKAKAHCGPDTKVDYREPKDADKQDDKSADIETPLASDGPAAAPVVTKPAKADKPKALKVR